MAKNKRKARYLDEQLNSGFYARFDDSDTRYYGLFLEKDRIKIDPKRMRNMLDGVITDEMFAAMSKRNTRYFYPLKRRQQDYTVYLFLNELNKIKNEWLNNYKPIIDETIREIVVKKYTAGDDANYQSGVSSHSAAEMRATVKNLTAEKLAKFKERHVISSMYAQFFHQAAAQLEAITVKVLYLRNVKVKGSFREAFDASAADSGVFFDEISGKKHHDKLYRIWNFIKHNNEDAYKKLQQEFPETLYPGKYKQGDLAIYYVKFDQELFTSLYQGLKEFYTSYCKDVSKETVFDSLWNYDEYFKKIVRKQIDFNHNPLGLDLFDDID